MPRPSHIWYWKARKQWCVKIKGERRLLGTDKEDAEREFHRLKSLPEEPRAAPGSVDELFSQFISFCAANRAKKTARWYKDFLISFEDFDPRLSMIRMHQLTPADVQAWVDSHKDWSPSTKRGAVVAVQRAYQWGFKSRILRENPLIGMEKAEVGRREKVISPDTFQEILSKVKDQEFRDYLETVWFTGARPQEISIVTAAHVDLPNGRWVFPVSQAKGKKKPRVVYLPGRALEITKRLMETHPDGPLFRTRRGTAWNASATNCRFQRLKAKLGDKYCVYLLRHSRTTQALEAGLSTEVVRELMGHRDGRMLEKHYSHISQNAAFMREQAERITPSPAAASGDGKGPSVTPKRSRKKK